MAETSTVSPAPEPNVIVERSGGLGILRLNRPKALNAVTLEMVRVLAKTLDEFAVDPAIGLVLVEGAGERGLCAGGDIRAIYESGRKGDGEAATFWREEYVMNAQIARFPKPYVAFMDGLVMGGGVGISAHGSHRVVTERTRLAMPETGIGFLPDVGGTWLLGKAPGETGTYLGLSGEIIAASDAVYAGLADVLISAADLPKVREALALLGPQTTHEVVRGTLKQFAQSPVTSRLEAHKNVIDAAMQSKNVEDILAALLQDGSEFAVAAANTIAGKSPTSLKLTLRLLRLARFAPDLETCLVNEYRGGTRLLDGHDFYEGVRAAVIDKDRQPRWSPADLKDVDEAAITALLLPTDNEPLFPK
ncbi:MAG TPA: enoyl-CoA hydratase/isomerase family protein [Beijerinckia sp.]|jgi:enoyl-CoA hydratase|nr:enoyl-CoA hydratase/isomerase family protein [Beijerinckia sp.]